MVSFFIHWFSATRLSLLIFVIAILRESPNLDEAEVDFNRDIRPILSENCFFCHGQDANKREAGLRLDQRNAVISAGVIVEGDSESSELIQRILDEDVDSVMPPLDSNRTLTNEQKQLMIRWVEQGAKYQNHWAFQKPKTAAIPKVKNRWKPWIRNPIDAFIVSRLEDNLLSPSPEADRETLIKRLHADLTGLPPTVRQVDEFVKDTDPRAYENLVDRLLRSPHYGERMALPWLDAARYADSNGFQQDGDTWQWIWRDWLIDALNQDMPFDQFTIWSLAGDLLPDATEEQKIASAFNRNHMLNGEGGAIAEEQRFVNLFDRVDTTATTWLGLTMACAQCHDHKYDPITQEDYYSFLDAFNRLNETGTPQRQSTRIRVARPFIELPTEENKAFIAELETKIKSLEPSANLALDAAYVGWKKGVGDDKALRSLPGLSKTAITILSNETGKRSSDQKQQLEKSLRKYFDRRIKSNIASQLLPVAEQNRLKNQLSAYKGDKIPRVMVMQDSKPRTTHILKRGEYLQKGEKVTFRTPKFLPPLPMDAPKNRLGLAKWLVSPDHPLTARVQVNRMWQYFFGMGLVKSSEDLGVQSEYPVHLDLLNWLAIEFQRQNWSVKKIHRLIVTSSTYRQSSRIQPFHLKHDPQNTLFSRAARFRMPAMVLRDWALSSSGLLNTKIGGAPVFPYLPENPWETLAITKERDFTYPQSKGDDLHRRSIYSFWRRTVAPANMFDASNRQSCRVRGSTTCTPLHALTTLNDPTWIEAAQSLAKHCREESADVDEQIAIAFQKVVCRHPRAEEITILKDSFDKQRVIYRNDIESARNFLSRIPSDSPIVEDVDWVELAALSSVCLGIFNLDESLTRE